MAVSTELQKIISSVPAGFNSPDDDFATVRKKMAPMHGHPLARDTEVEQLTIDGMAAAWLQVAANNNDDERIALFCHGGGFVSCPMDTYLFYAEHISRHLGCKVFTPDYRLAPEARFPAALDDCLAAYRYLLDSDIDPQRIVFTGDSCGGGLALSVLQRAKAEGLPMPACYVGLTAWYDLTLAGESAIDPGGPDPFITPGWFRARAQDYLGDADPADPCASPVYADCSTYPPMLIQVGGSDITRDSAVDMARVAGKYGVNVELQIWAGMVHGWHGLVSSGVPESAAAWLSARNFVDRHLGS